MDQNYRQLLEGCDEAGAYEFPADFDYEALERAAVAVHHELRDRLGLETRFEGAALYQDASFSIAISLLDYARQEGNITCQPVIRFSNFGRLCTLTMVELIPTDVASKIPAVLEAGGFHYLPEEVLNAVYDGVMAGNEALPTWWVRYFDWL